jgi:general secretion pathway protein F
MANYSYIAVDPRGGEARGVLEVGSQTEAVRRVREMGLFPTKIKVTEHKQRRRIASRTAEADAGTSPFASRFRRVKAAKVVVFTRQLATLVKSALPLEEALLAVSQQTDKPKVRSVILGVRARVMEGHTLADGLSNFRGSFPEIYRATVAASEQSGHLDSVLERLADYTESRQELRQRTVGALLYPVLLFMVCIAIVVFLLLILR